MKEHGLVEHAAGVPQGRPAKAVPALQLAGRVGNRAMNQMLSRNLTESERRSARQERALRRRQISEAGMLTIINRSESLLSLQLLAETLEATRPSARRAPVMAFVPLVSSRRSGTALAFDIPAGSVAGLMQATGRRAEALLRRRLEALQRHQSRRDTLDRGQAVIEQGYAGAERFDPRLHSPAGRARAVLENVKWMRNAGPLTSITFTARVLLGQDLETAKKYADAFSLVDSCAATFIPGVAADARPPSRPVGIDSPAAQRLYDRQVASYLEGLAPSGRGPTDTPGDPDYVSAEEREEAERLRGSARQW